MRALQPQECSGDNQVPQIEDITDTFTKHYQKTKKKNTKMQNLNISFSKRNR